MADSVGSLLAYDALCRQPSQARVDTSEGEEEAEGGQRPGLVRQSSSRRTQTASRHLSVNNHEAGDTNFHFDVGHFFLLGSPLPIVLAHRQTAGQPQPPRPNCVQVNTRTKRKSGVSDVTCRFTTSSIRVTPWWRGWSPCWFPPLIRYRRSTSRGNTGREVTIN